MYIFFLLFSNLCISPVPIPLVSALLPGAQGLDKKARKSFEAEERIRLGGRPDKGPRIPASIGVGARMKRGQGVNVWC